MTIFDTLWNRNKGLPRGDVTVLEGRNLADSPRPRKDVTPYLKNIFYEKQHAEYVGATLSFKDNDDEIVLINMNKGLNEDENFWLCMNYVKYKGQNTVWYDGAEKYLLSRNDMEVEVAKLFLTRKVENE